MAVILNSPDYMALPISIKRGNPAPVDTTAVWYAKADLETYAKSGATAYIGQILTLVEDGKCEAYMISNEAGTLIKLASTTASGDLASDVAALQGQVADLISKVGKAAAGEEAATGLYKEIADVLTIANKGVSDAATAQATADAAQADVDALEEVVGADDTTGLRKRIKVNEDAIGILNGSGDGSVDKKISVAIADVVGGAPDTFDTLKEISDWISEHGTEASNMTTAIAALEAILAGFGTDEGETATVKAYVDDAVAALKIGDYAKAADLTALAGRVDTLEKKPAASITQAQIDAWTAKQDAGGYVDQSAYDTKIEALEAADTTNSEAIAAVKATADAAVVANTAITAGTATKITYDAKGLVIKGENLVASDIPTLGISKIDGLQAAIDAKQDNLTFDGEYNSATNKVATVATVNTAVDNLIHVKDSEGNDIDTSASETIHGAKIYADEKAAAVLTSAKSYADGLVGESSDIAGRVSTLESKVDVDKVSTAITTAKEEAAIDAANKVKAAKTAILGESAEGVDFDKTVKEVYDLANSKTTMAEVEAKGYAVKADTDTAIADAKKAGTDAQASVDALSAKVGTVAEGKTVIQLIAEAQAAATYDDTAIKADIKANTDAIAVLNGNTSQDGSVDKKVQDAINDFATKVSDDGTVNTFKELVDYVAAHGSDYTAAIGNIAKNTASIETLNGDASTAGSVDKKVKDAVDALNISDYAKTSEVDTKLEDYVAKNGTDRLMTVAEGNKLKDIAEGAQVNVLESIKVNGVAQEITDKAVDIKVPVADGTSIQNVENTFSIKKVSTDLLKQGANTLVLNGGNAESL